MTRPIVKRAERWPWVWAAIVVVLLVALSAALVAYLHASAAIHCTNNAVGTRSIVGRPDPLLNDVLGRRPGTIVTDSDAFNAVLSELVKAQKLGTPAPQEERVLFFRVVAHAKDVLDANQAFRAANPLGEC